jgi:hypothetical protein
MSNEMTADQVLDILEAWTQKRYQKCDKMEVLEVRSFVQQLRTNPDQVRQQGIEEGWLP